VLFADTKQRVIGAAHSGWKGTCNGVLEATLAAMKELGAKLGDTQAIIGPCIRWDSYEVGPEFIEMFAASDGESAQFFKPSGRAGHYYFNLPGVVHKKLEDAGVGQVLDIGIDTYTNPDTCFSFRRHTHYGDAMGSMLSVVMLK
jgi:YfiH family protein